jgi:hypothetical protein
MNLRLTFYIVNKIEGYYVFENLLPTIVPTKEKDPMTAATNTVSAVDANGSPTTPINIEYIIIINPINANSPKTMDLTSSLDLSDMFSAIANTLYLMI